uniref:protein NETWORKED 4B-like isoform X2 n=1 Tax=Erigeron canadensis TaxID=72917 RepID=UPI001CB9D3F4|nr:protein NETWORKED 4B-like isoform X2 [Erigeron canadensis]
MEVVESKSQSLGENGHQISPEISVCLAENVEGFQQCIKEILVLIEKDGSFPDMTSEIYDEKKSELKTHVTELSRMHGLLADQHVHLIGEVSRNCPSLIKNQNLDPCDSSSPQVTQMFTPDQMSNTRKFKTPIGFDVMSSGGGGSSIYKIEGSESSFSLSSDSDSESFMSINKLLISPVNDDAMKAKETKVPDVLLSKISCLEEEVASLNKKLQILEDENTKLKQKIQESESDFEIQNTHLEDENAKLKHKIQESETEFEIQNSHLEVEKAKVIELQKQVDDLEFVIYDSNYRNKSMGEELEASREKLLAAEDNISKLKQELSSKIFEQTHWLQGQLGLSQQEIALLQKQLDSEKDKNLGLQEEVYSFVVDISVRDDQISELDTKIDHFMSEISLLKSTHEAKEDSLNADIRRLRMEVEEKCQLVEYLNKKMDALMLEKDGVKAQLDTLQAEKCHQGNVIQELETCLNALQTEHVQVLSSFDNAQKVTDELTLKVADLEREVDRQREVISDRAEEKREAIRQLSFSLEHYMSGYKELRQAFVGNKRRAVLTS